MSTQPNDYEAGQPSYSFEQCLQTYQASNGQFWRQLGLAMPEEIRILPQHDYVSQRRYTPQRPITFRLIRSGSLRLKDLRDGNAGPIHGGEDLVFPVPDDNFGQKQTIRLNVVGEGIRQFERQINVRYPSNSSQSITRAALARKIAKEIYEYMQHNHVPLGDPSLRIGPGTVGFDRLILLELRHVSKSSWQPILGILPL